jgi:hypothetical protein
VTTPLEELQQATCKRLGAAFCPSPLQAKVGIANNVRTGLKPINGLRHPIVGDSTGWYIWAGETISNAADYFIPLHVTHLDQWCPAIKKYLGLPPGWRFLVADEYEDVWFDESLLKV